jgi:hypothetical protein
MADEPGTAGGRGGQIATTILVMESAASIFAAFCPSWFTTRSPFFHEQNAREGNIQSIRQGWVTATLLTIPTGIAASVLVDSWLPAIGSVIISAVMIGGYEYSISHPASAVPSTPPSWVYGLTWGAAKS